jgi:peptide/nickel transport system substrate-binding protein
VKARNLLTDAGWGWDDDGNLRYPADVDPSPQWPDDGRPDPAGYPCYDGEWNFVPPEER